MSARARVHAWGRRSRGRPGSQQVRQRDRDAMRPGATWWGSAPLPEDRQSGTRGRLLRRRAGSGPGARRGGKATAPSAHAWGADREREEHVVASGARGDVAKRHEGRRETERPGGGSSRMSTPKSEEGSLTMSMPPERSPYCWTRVSGMPRPPRCRGYRASRWRRSCRWCQRACWQSRTSSARRNQSAERPAGQAHCWQVSLKQRGPRSAYC